MKKLAMILVGISVSSFAFAQEGVYVQCTEHSDSGQNRGTYDFSKIALTYGTSSTMMSSVFNGEKYYVGIADAGLVASKRVRCSLKPPGQIGKEQGDHHQQPIREQAPSKPPITALTNSTEKHVFPPAPMIDHQEEQLRTDEPADSKGNSCGAVDDSNMGPTLQIILMKLPSHADPKNDIQIAHHVKSVKLYPGETKKVQIEYRGDFLWSVETKLKCTIEYPAQGL